MSYQALVLNNDSAFNEQLRSALRTMELFDAIECFGSPEEEGLTDHLLSKTSTIFITANFGKKRVRRFLKRLKSAESYTGAGVIILSEKGFVRSYVTRLYHAGADGFLANPYSLESLVSVVELCNQIRAHKQADRMTKGIRLLTKELASQLDQVACVKKSGSKGAISFRLLQEMADVLDDLDPDELDSFYEILIEEFSQRPPITTYDVLKRSKEPRRVKTSSQEQEQVEPVVRLKDIG